MYDEFLQMLCNSKDYTFKSSDINLNEDVLNMYN